VDEAYVVVLHASHGPFGATCREREERLGAAAMMADARGELGSRKARLWPSKIQRQATGLQQRRGKRFAATPPIEP